MARRSRERLAADARAALAKSDAGRALNRDDRRALEIVSRETGAKRDLASYSPRTRRRYLSAFTREESVHDANAREYRERRSRQLSTRAQIMALYWWLRDKLTEWEEKSRFLEDDLEDAIAVYGEAQILRRFTRERESVEHYLQGSKAHGNRYWNNRDLQPLRGVDITDFTDPMFFYHGRQS